MKRDDDDDTRKLPIATFDDGFDGPDDEVGRSIIKGTKLKFGNDAVWRTGNDETISLESEYTVVGQVRMVQKWLPNQTNPAETLILAPAEKFPDVEAWNDKAPPEEFTEKFGRRFPPWQRGYVLYLIDASMQVFSFPTSTTGGMRAVRELRDAVRLARRLQGPNVAPVVALASTFMRTQFGGRQRPHFRIKRFVTPGGDQTSIDGGGEPKALEDKRQGRRTKLKPRGSSQADFNDDIPF